MQCWRPEGPRASVSSRAPGERKDRSDTPRRVLSLVYKQKTMTRPEPQLRSRPISECMEVIALGLSNNWETPEERNGTDGSYGRREYNELLKCGY